MVKLGGNKDATRNTLQAQELGGQAVARGNQQLLNQQNLANQQIIEGAESGQRAYIQHRQEQTQKAQFAEQQALARRGQDIEMADKGLEEREKPQAGQPQQDPNFVGPPSPMDQRMANLRESMARSKEVAEITDLGTNAGSRKTEIVQGAARQARERAEIEARTSHAAAAEANARANVLDARAKGDKEQVKEARHEIFRSVRATTKTLGLLNKSTTSIEEKMAIGQSLKKDPMYDFPDPTLRAEIDEAAATGIIGPRIREALSAKRSKDILTIAQHTGEMPDDDDYDERDPRMRKFNAAKDAAHDVIYSYGSALPKWLDFQSVGEKSRYLNKLCAQAALEGWDQLIVNLSPAQQQQQQQQQGAQQNVQPGSQPAAPGGAAAPAPGGAAAGGQQQPPKLVGNYGGLASNQWGLRHGPK